MAKAGPVGPRGVGGAGGSGGAGRGTPRVGRNRPAAASKRAQPAAAPARKLRLGLTKPEAKPAMPVSAPAPAAKVARKAKATAKAKAKAAPKARAASTAPRNLVTLDFARTLRLNSYNLLVFGLIIAGVFTLAPGVQIWFAQQQTIADVAAQVAQAKRDVAQMEIERGRWDDPVYVRSQARDRLYYVMPGEISYLVMDAKGISEDDTAGTVGAKIAAAKESGEVTSSIRESKDNWVDGLLYTVMHAGLDTP